MSSTKLDGGETEVLHSECTLALKYQGRYWLSHGSHHYTSTLSCLNFTNCGETNHIGV